MAELSITGMEEATIRSVWGGVWLWAELYVVQFINSLTYNGDSDGSYYYFILFF